MQDPGLMDLLRSQYTVASSFLIILLQKSSSPLQVPISSPLLSCNAIKIIYWLMIILAV